MKEALICLLLSCPFCQAGWEDLWWSAGPGNYKERAGQEIPKGQICLYWKDEPIGLLDVATGQWKTLHDGKVYDLREQVNRLNPKDQRDKEKPVPAVKEDGDPAQPNYIPSRQHQKGYKFGVMTDKLSKEEMFCKDGKETSKDDVIRSMYHFYTSGVPTDWDVPRITVIGPEADRARVLGDLRDAPELSWLKGKCLVQDYPPDHWRVVDGGFVNTGKPTIYCQAPDGTVLWRQDEYKDAKSLSLALRDKIPGYDPRKDPQPSSPAPDAPSSGGTKITVLWVVALSALVYYLINRNKKAVVK